MAYVPAEHILRTRLAANTAVAAIVGTRIAPGQGEFRPDAYADMPLITYGRSFGQHFAHMKGASGLQAVSVEIDMHSKDYNQIVDLADKTRLALQGFRGTVTVGTSTAAVQEISLDDERGLFTQPTGGASTGAYRMTQTYTVWQSETVPSF